MSMKRKVAFQMLYCSKVSIISIIICSTLANYRRKGLFWLTVCRGLSLRLLVSQAGWHSRRAWWRRNSPQAEGDVP